MDALFTAFITKGIDFLWNEASRILDMYRNAKREKGDTLPSKIESTHKPDILATPLECRISHDLVGFVETEMDSLIEQLRTHRYNLNYHMEQQASMGNLTPVSVVNSIKYEEQNLLKKGKRLKDLIEKVYEESISFTFKSP